MLIGLDTIADLWELLGWRSRLPFVRLLGVVVVGGAAVVSPVLRSQSKVTKHFFARLLCLVAIPCAIYVLTFYVSFRMLHKSGPGDILMSPSFQTTLDRNPISSSPRLIAYGSLIVLRHDNTFHYLHSHRERYPARYSDGRISSQGQQVFAAETQGPGSLWMVLPSDESLDFQDHTVFVKNGDVVRLQHYETGTFLYTHDVSSPLHPKFTEVVADSPSYVNHILSLFSSFLFFSLFFSVCFGQDSNP